MFLIFLEEGDVCVLHLDFDVAVDFFLACQQSKMQDRDTCPTSPKQYQKALSWLAKVAIIPHLHQLVAPPRIKGIIAGETPKERKNKVARTLVRPALGHI